MKNQASTRESEEKTVLDAVDRSIILALQRDGRMPYSTLAEEIGLSQAAARQRVNKLVEGGVIRVVAITDPLKLGFRIQAEIGINVSGDPRPVADALKALPQVEYLRFTAGRFEIMAEALFESAGQMHEFVNGELRDIPGVEQVECLIVLELLKETHDWGVPDLKGAS